MVVKWIVIDLVSNNDDGINQFVLQFKRSCQSFFPLIYEMSNDRKKFLSFVQSSWFRCCWNICREYKKNLWLFLVSRSVVLKHGVATHLRTTALGLDVAHTYWRMLPHPPSCDLKRGCGSNLKREFSYLENNLTKDILLFFLLKK